MANVFQWFEIVCIAFMHHWVRKLQGGPKNKPLPNYKKFYSIVSIHMIEIRFIRQLKI